VVNQNSVGTTAERALQVQPQHQEHFVRTVDVEFTEWKTVGYSTRRKSPNTCRRSNN
jgi:hypothetical protein